MGHRDDGCPINFVFIEWFSRRVNGVFRCRGGSVSCSRIVSAEALFFLLLVVRLLSLWFLSGLLFSLRLRCREVACFAVRLLVFPFFFPLLAFRDESGRTTCNQ